MKRIQSINPGIMAKNIFTDICATALWAIAINMVILPNEIAPGGATGITVIVNYLTGAQIGVLSFFINLPLLIWAWFVLGRNFVGQTLRTIVIFSVMVDYVIPLFPMIPEYTNDPLMASIMAGVLNGVGTAFVFMHGSSGGGTDLLTKIVKRLRPHLSVGQIVLVVNSVVMTSAALVYQNLDALLYGLVMSFTGGQVIDLILNGASSANNITIMTTKPKEISQAIITDLHRSATIVQGEGAYAHQELSVMFCIVRKHEMQKLREVVNRADPRAFLVVQEAKQVFGGNFVAPST